MKKNALSIIITLVVIFSFIWVIMKFPTDNMKTKKQIAEEEALELVSFERTKDSIINLDTLNYQNLKSKYNAVEINFDTTDFTYEIEDRIKSSKRPLLLEGRVIDIINNKENESSNYKGLNQNKVYKIIATYESVSIYKKFIIKVIIDINETMFTKLIVLTNKRGQRMSNYNSEYFYFVINPKSFTKLSPILKAENGTNVEDNVELYYDIDEVVFKLEGTLVDFYNPHIQKLYQNGPSPYANL